MSARKARGAGDTKKDTVALVSDTLSHCGMSKSTVSVKSRQQNSLNTVQYPLLLDIFQINYVFDFT